MTSEAMIRGKKRATRKLGRVLVLGFGKSGQDAVEYCLALLGDRVDVLCIAAGDRNARSEVLACAAEARGAQIAFGDDAVGWLAAQVAGLSFDLCIPSPGIPPSSPLYRAAVEACAEVVSEVEFAWRESAADSRWVAVTGTNGKTTVASCTAHILRSAGMRAAAVGNIGDTCIKAVAEGGVEVYVAEVSSYQLHSTSDFAPNVAILLNITPDHLQWHESFEAYRDAKVKILANLDNVPGAVAVLDATNDEVRLEVRRLRESDQPCRKFSYLALGAAAGINEDMRLVCGSANAAFINEEGFLCVAFGEQEHKLINACELQVKGQHNASNALAAGAAALALGADVAGVRRGLLSFAPLEHRIEPCGFVQGIACYNDSKATNVDATLKAIAAFPGTRLIILLGGDDKGTNLDSLVSAARRLARVVVCYGAAGPRFAAAFGESCAKASLLKKPADSALSAGVESSQDFTVLCANNLEHAFDSALLVAQEEDIILLSPACASFDEFSSFEERGSVFKALVCARRAQSEG